jgi:hypothetical protein
MAKAWHPRRIQAWVPTPEAFVKLLIRELLMYALIELPELKHHIYLAHRAFP